MARQSCNQMICFSPDDVPSRNPPWPPFDKGGLGGFQMGITQKIFRPPPYPSPSRG